MQHWPSEPELVGSSLPGDEDRRLFVQQTFDPRTPLRVEVVAHDDPRLPPTNVDRVAENRDPSKSPESYPPDLALHGFDDGSSGLALLVRPGARYQAINQAARQITLERVITGLARHPLGIPRAVAQPFSPAVLLVGSDGQLAAERVVSGFRSGQLSTGIDLHPGPNDVEPDGTVDLARMVERSLALRGAEVSVAVGALGLVAVHHPMLQHPPLPTPIIVARADVPASQLAASLAPRPSNEMVFMDLDDPRLADAVSEGKLVTYDKSDAALGLLMQAQHAGVALAPVTARRAPGVTNAPGSSLRTLRVRQEGKHIATFVTPIHAPEGAVGQLAPTDDPVAERRASALVDAATGARRYDADHEPPRDVQVDLVLGRDCEMIDPPNTYVPRRVTVEDGRAVLWCRPARRMFEVSRLLSYIPNADQERFCHVSSDGTLPPVATYVDVGTSVVRTADGRLLARTGEYGWNAMFPGEALDLGQLGPAGALDLDAPGRWRYDTSGLDQADFEAQRARFRATGLVTTLTGHGMPATALVGVIETTFTSDELMERIPTDQRGNVVVLPADAPSLSAELAARNQAIPATATDARYGLALASHDPAAVLRSLGPGITVEQIAPEAHRDGLDESSSGDRVPAPADRVPHQLDIIESGGAQTLVEPRSTGSGDDFGTIGP